MKRKGSLPNLSSSLGAKWCGNGDLEGMVVDSKKFLDPTTGPVITAAIRYRYNDYPDGFPHGLFIQDAGVPIGVDWYLTGKLLSPSSKWHLVKLIWYFFCGFLNRAFGKFFRRRTDHNISDEIVRVIDQNSFTRRIFILLGMGRDRSDGWISLGPTGEAKINWSLDKSELHYDRVRFEMKRIATQLGGVFMDNPLTHLKKVVAVHPLGGCAMAESPNEGVVGTNGEVFGHPGLYVVDASILPTSVGPNPSLTIAALAEMIADQFPAEPT